MSRCSHIEQRPACEEILLSRLCLPSPASGPRAGEVSSPPSEALSLRYLSAIAGETEGARRPLWSLPPPPRAARARSAPPPLRFATREREQGSAGFDEFCSHIEQRSACR